ncbi:Yip1 family protein [Vulgatibacter incomptus]|uniref:Yip1 domain-containing protein n=1 Tax=Vulgatibacter incomptus TaxID=1391653 RepID=A0A0K1PHH1_9BACT|nr:Yip1 family protein [Vulgatibacter incomptus]AKU92564.1 hypothetical protein AKJ08_2951 [Vulgatibacter incomptus]
MDAERNRIREMLAAGKISPEEANKRMAELDSPPATAKSLLTRPIEHLGTRQALIISTVVAVLQLVVSRLHVRFDGALDAHLSAMPVSWPQAIIDLVLAWPVVALIFWGAARLIAHRGEFVDLLAVVGVARAPLVVAGAVAGFLRHAFEEATTGRANPGMIIGAILMIVLVIWFISLLVTGFRAVSRLSGAKLALTSIGAIIVAEVVTKVVLAIL